MRDKNSKLAFWLVCHHNPSSWINMSYQKGRKGVLFSCWTSCGCQRKKENVLLSLVTLRRKMLENRRRLIPCSVIEGDGCGARRGVQGLLRTSVQDVNICSKSQIIWHSDNNTLNVRFKMRRFLFMPACVVLKSNIMKIWTSLYFHFFSPPSQPYFACP